MADCPSLCRRYADSLWPARAAPTAAAICAAESGGDPNARCLNCAGVVEDSRGLWQINVATGANPQYAGWDLYDPATNARAALALSRNGDDWSDWSTYRSGTYQAY